MEVFQSLGAKVESLWRADNYNEEVFPSLAAEALKSADMPSKVSVWEIVEWTLKQNELPRQKDPAGRFGDPPITIFVAPRFYIDAYIWLNGTTAIHQHGFCGAFQVLLGSSIHSWYEFEPREKISSMLELGHMRLKLCELLKVGDVQPIRAGRQYIHALFHLDQPSVSLVIRTDKSPLYLPQFSYHRPTIAVDPFYEHETTSRKMQTIGALFQIKHPDADRMISELLSESDFHTSYLIMQTVNDWVGSDKIGHLFGIEDSNDQLGRFLDIVRSRHGDKADEIAAALRDATLSAELIRRRAVVSDPEQRFFLAILLNVEGRENVCRLISQRFPDDDPIDKILDWTFDLAQTRVVGMHIPNALGIADFDAFDLQILEYLLRGERDMVGKLSAELPSETEASLTEKVDRSTEKLRSSVVLGPLLT